MVFLRVVSHLLAPSLTPRVCSLARTPSPQEYLCTRCGSLLSVLSHPTAAADPAAVAQQASAPLTHKARTVPPLSRIVLVVCKSSRLFLLPRVWSAAAEGGGGEAYPRSCTEIGMRVITSTTLPERSLSLCSLR